ncbi:MAG: 23S rRNA (adenine(2503)-C(2))-methyltransferase RlmN [Treponema sp.]|jgi:23S rRNA (adenine2503-C2)-methyltransferase|nr:23S rRNA (adenine(2503)-C(2))-methyltransferase RlmN [Treponema sp.]
MQGHTGDVDVETVRMNDGRTGGAIQGVRKTALAGLSIEALTDALKPLPAFRAKQIFRWLTRGVRSFNDMTDISYMVREALDKRFSLYSSVISRRLSDADGTVKLQLTLEDGCVIESVLLSDDEGRKTACLSTQAGCAMGCVFCKTGAIGFRRNLSTAEIIEQFLHLISMGAIANVVIMGMGEPLLNLNALREALSFITGELGFSKRRVTLSTSGIAAGIRDLADNGPGVRLAVSLTTADEPLRERLMPVTRTNPLPLLKETLIYYQRKHSKRITLETVLLRHINTSHKDAELVARFADDLDVAINVIPWNPVAGMRFEGAALGEPDRAEVERFIAALQKKGLNVTKRFKKGRGVAGACGQLG